ncbi:hypothetical protein D3C77_394140 [compost metagenome]
MCFAGNRRVPRRNGGDHAHRFIDTHADEIAAGGGDGFFQGFAGRGKELEGAGGTGHQGTGFIDRLAVVLALQLRQLFAALTDQFGDAIEHGGSLVWFALGPAAVEEGLMRALHGLVDIIEAGGVEPSHRLAGGRVARGIALTATLAPGSGDANR